jgi:hypothetical protein
MKLMTTRAVRPEGYREKKAIFRVYQFIWYILAFIEICLAFRFVFRLSAARAGSPFVSLIYQLTAPLVAPFRGIYPTMNVSGSTFEWVILIAMLVWAIVAYAIIYIFQIIKPVDEGEVEEVVDNP